MKLKTLVTEEERYGSAAPVIAPGGWCCCCCCWCWCSISCMMSLEAGDDEEL